MTLILILIMLAACAPKPADKDSVPAASAAPDTQVAAPITAAPPTGGGAQAPALGQLMAGSWDISPSGIGGPHLTIEVRSTGAATFRGQLTRAVAGDVLLDTERFQPFTGTVGPDSVFRVTIEWKEKGLPPAELVGKVAGDELRLTRFVWGGEQQVLPGRTWTGRRAKG